MLKQIIAVTSMNFKALRNRFWPSLVIVVGMACVVGVLLSMMSFTIGIVTSFDGAGDPGRAIVVSQGAQGEGGSNLPRGNLAIIADAPGIAKDAAGKPAGRCGNAVHRADDQQGATPRQLHVAARHGSAKHRAAPQVQAGRRPASGLAPAS